jgi:predicted RecA/RadA family phage recombinase
MADSKLLRLDPLDNVLVAIQTLEAGDTVHIEDRVYTIPYRLTLGHKLAARDIRSGEKILKYHMPIGSAIRDIAAGEHVHLHNMKSDYLDTVAMQARHSLAGHHPEGHHDRH